MATAISSFTSTDARPTLLSAGRFDTAPLRSALRDLVPFGWLRGEQPNVSLAGEIRQSGALCDLFGWLAQSGKTGTLVVANTEGVRALAIERGELAGAATTIAGERIGELLRRTAAIAAEDIDEASVMAAIDGSTVGQVLLAEGRIDSATLDALLRRRAEEIVYAALRVEEGVFCLVDESVAVPALPGSRPSLLSLLMESARRADEMNVYREVVPSAKHVPVVTTPDGFQEAAPEHATILALVDGARSVEDIGREARLLEFEVTEVIYRLAKSKKVTIAPPRECSSIEEALVALAEPIMVAARERTRRPRSRRARQAVI